MIIVDKNRVGKIKNTLVLERLEQALIHLIESGNQRTPYTVIT